MWWQYAADFNYGAEGTQPFDNSNFGAGYAGAGYGGGRRGGGGSEQHTRSS